MKKLFIFIALIVAFMLFTGGSCEGESSADKKQTQATKKAMAEADAQIGMPAIVNFQERKLAKAIFELRDKADLICYAYIKSDYTGKLVFLGKCVGYGLPYSVQYTNPQYIADYSAGGYAILPQPDPNGLFMPEGLSATWLMLINPKTGKASATYVEPEIVVSSFPLH